MMPQLALGLVFLPIALGFYAYVGYPLALKLISAVRRRPLVSRDPAQLPMISITVPAYNEETQIAGVIEALLALDYPPDRRQILIVSDASSDRTDDIVRSYADRGVELLRMPVRAGKTAAENAAGDHLRGEIVINTDASIRIAPEAVRRLVRQFSDPTIGLASGRDVSVSRNNTGESNRGESGYVGYEMTVRDLETSVNGIVGASGCFYAIRKELHKVPLPEALSRDFAAALNTQERGYRAISVNDALCQVPRAPSLKREYRRKVRTITRGMETLLYKRALLNPFRHGMFAWMLFSHKVCRWLLPWAGVVGLIGLLLLATQYAVAAWLAAAGVLLLIVVVVAWSVSDRVRLPRILQMLAFGVFGNLAVLHASIRAMRGDRDATWEPTRRESASGLARSA